MSERYTDGVLDEKFLSVENKLEVHFDAQGEMLKRIEEQTKKTNGSVADLKVFREQFMGGAKVAIPLMSILTAAMGWLTVDYLNHRDKEFSQEQIQAAVAAGISDALANYETKP